MRGRKKVRVEKIFAVAFIVCLVLLLGLFMQQTFSYRVALFNEDIVDEITDVDKGISGNVVDDVVAEVVNVDQTNLGAAIIQEINIEDALEDCEGFDLKSSLVVYSEGFLRCG